MFMCLPKSLMWNIHTGNHLNISLRDYIFIKKKNSIFLSLSVLFGMKEFQHL